MESQQVAEMLQQAQLLHDQTSQMMQQAQVNENFVWVLICAALVFTMQFGFMYLEAGLAQAKHTINVAIKNLSDFVVSVMVFWLFGFGLMFGTSWGGLVGGSDFLISVQDKWMAAFFVFQVVFVGTAATINSGAVAGRTKFSSYLVLSALISGLIYPLFGHWAWGGLLLDQAGWLEALGFKDFAGSTVVHPVGGWVALAGIMVVGPRIGKFKKDGTPNKIPPYSLPEAVMGTMILFFGWFGFNCGSTLEATPEIASIGMTTVLAACFAAASSTALSWIFSENKRPEVESICNGVLGGLVGITAGCAFVDASSAMIIGLVSGVVVYYSTILIERVFKLDDVVGAVAVHGFCGVWGTVAVGLFDMKEGLFSGGGFTLLGVQTLGVVVCFAWTFGVAYLVIKLIDKFIGMRVSREDEERGLNIAEHGAKMSWYDTIMTMQDIVKTGDLRKRVDVEHGTEAGAVAIACNSMLHDMQQTADVARRVAGGDLSQSIAPKGEHDVLGQAVARMVASLRLRSKEQEDTIAKVHEIVATGDLTSRLTASPNSELAGLAESFNELLTSINDAAMVARQVAQGELEHQVIPKSDRDILNAAIATMLESLRQKRQSRRETVQAIGAIVETGDLERRVPVNGDPEMARVAHGFNSLLDEIHKSATIILQVAEGDLRHTVAAKSDKDILSLATNTMVAGLRELLEKVHDVSYALGFTIDDLDRASQGLEQSNFELVRSIELTANHVDNSINAVQAMTDQARAGTSAKEQSLGHMDEIGRTLAGLADTIQNFDTATERIAAFTESIRKIAAQTNLLALNATIEAAGAGSHGRGFAVVAGEIKTLALESARASDEVEQLVEGIQKETSQAVERARRSKDSTRSISEDMAGVLVQATDGIRTSVQDVTAKIETISSSSSEQLEVVNRNAQSVDTIASIARLLHEKAQSLAEAVGYFKLHGQEG